MRDVLLIDDDGEILRSLSRALSSLISPYTQCAAGTAEAAQKLYREERPKVVVLDLCLDDRLGVENGFSLIKRFQEIHDAVRIIVLTGHGSVENGVRALQLGAASFLEKPVDPIHLAALIKDGVKQASLLRERQSLLLHRLSDSGALIGSSPAMIEIREQVLFVASTDQPILLMGETGTGKGVCARLIHEASARRSHSFVPYHPNFGGLDLIQSELCGHIRGAFTGAHADRVGLIREADGGTLFLDELDEVPKETQIRLLDVVQEKRVRPVGSDALYPVDCRIIAASNRPLAELLESGKLRVDLYHRIAHGLIELPPLRQRRDDIPELARSFLARFVVREGATIIDFAEEALDVLCDHDWPGNVRELQAVVEAALFRAKYARRERIIEKDIHTVATPEVAIRERITSVVGVSLQEQLNSYKRRAIEETLKQCNGNQVLAARELGIDRGMIRRVLSKNVT